MYTNPLAFLYRTDHHLRGSLLPIVLMILYWNVSSLRADTLSLQSLSPVLSTAIAHSRSQNTIIEQIKKWINWIWRPLESIQFYYLIL